MRQEIAIRVTPPEPAARAMETIRSTLVASGFFEAVTFTFVSDALAWGHYVPERRAVEYAVGTHEEITPGIFYKLTGALSSRGQRILSAEIHTLADGLVLDHFYVEDRDFGPVER